MDAGFVAAVEDGGNGNKPNLRWSKQGRLLPWMAVMMVTSRCCGVQSKVDCCCKVLWSGEKPMWWWWEKEDARKQGGKYNSPCLLVNKHCTLSVGSLTQSRCGESHKQWPASPTHHESETAVFPKRAGTTKLAVRAMLGRSILNEEHSREVAQL